MHPCTCDIHYIHVNKKILMSQILLNPGPVVLSERVRNAMLRPDLCHREAEFAELQNTIRHDLLKVYPLPEDEWAAILMPGFHPWKHDDRALLGKTQSDYAAAVMPAE
ncbi:MAG: hypothetical protein IIA99_01835 [Proteobacteria bacterium]|nr:hypothetical protein [Pseudomonadota bacterium]